MGEQLTEIEQAIARQRVKGHGFMSDKRREKIRSLEQEASKDERERTAQKRLAERTKATAKGRS